MKVEFEIDIEKLKEQTIKLLAEKAMSEIWDAPYTSGVSYEKREEISQKRRAEILAKIDWKNAGSQLSETVVRKFFEKLLESK